MTMPGTMHLYEMYKKGKHKFMECDIILMVHIKEDISISYAYNVIQILIAQRWVI